ncbi:MAG TPA: hypothetical protein VJA23_04680 [Candidatus Nanoarchaeia archaeon]|nr:hypothetical protein [Candidatus Nanoarchaeia archaeon]
MPPTELKVKNIPLFRLRPTEPILSESGLQRIARKHKKDPSSVLPIDVYDDGNGNYLIDNGNHQAVFCHLAGNSRIKVYVWDDPDTAKDLEILAERALDLSGVKSIADLAQKVYSARDYRRLINQLEAYYQA